MGVYTFVSSVAGEVGRAEDMGSGKVDGGPSEGLCEGENEEGE